MLIRYRSNNSGGRWWLKDADWYKLEKAGWTVAWQKDEKSSGFFKKEPDENGEIRWLGALAVAATFEAETPADAMRSFEKATGQDVSNEGCNCCGPPHAFTWGGKEYDEVNDVDIDTGIPYGYASGEGCLYYLFPNKEIKSLREMLEED